MLKTRLDAVIDRAIEEERIVGTVVLAAEEVVVWLQLLLRFLCGCGVLLLLKRDPVRYSRWEIVGD